MQPAANFSNFGKKFRLIGLAVVLCAGFFSGLGGLLFGRLQETIARTLSLQARTALGNQNIATGVQMLGGIQQAKADVPVGSGTVSCASASASGCGASCGGGGGGGGGGCCCGCF